MSDADQLVARIEALGEKLQTARAAVARRFIGQDRVVELALSAMLGGGHALLVGLPGLGKTLLVDTLSTVMGLTANRIQFTPDLMPADILGSEVLETAADGARAFRFLPGPVFCQLLMADEINRASPRTQSALLQAMQEREVTIAGQHRKLGPPVPRARHPEPDRAGGHLSAARGAARPVPGADRRRLSQPRGRTRDPAGHHRGPSLPRPRRSSPPKS